VDVVVRAHGRARRQHAQAARHAQVQQRAAGLRVQQQVLGAPAHRVDALAREQLHHLARDRPAQVRAAQHHVGDATAFDVRREAAAGGFDFGQFRHRRSIGFPDGTECPRGRRPADLRRRARGGGADRAARARHAGAAIAHPGRAGRLRAALQGRAPAAHRRVQVPRRLQRGLGTARRSRRARRGHPLLRQPRRRAGAGRGHPRHPLPRGRARGRDRGQARGDPRLRRGPAPLRADHGRARGDRRARATRDRRHLRAPVRRSAGDRRPGHRGAGTAQRQWRLRRGGGPGRRRRTGGGHRVGAGRARARLRTAARRTRGRGRHRALAGGRAPRRGLRARHRLRRPARHARPAGLRDPPRARRARDSGRGRGYPRRPAPAVDPAEAAGRAVVGDRAGRGAAAARPARRQARGRDPFRRQRGYRGCMTHRSLRAPGAWIAALALVLALLLPGLRGIWDADEGRYTNVALQMVDSGAWLSPHRSEQTGHWTKPPLTYWAIAASVEVFGRNPWAARLPGSLAYLLCAWLAFRIARRLAPGSERVAALAFATMLLPFGAAHYITTDFLLAAAEALAMWGFVEARFGDRRYARRWLALMWAGFGLAFLTKGPPGLLPLLAVFAFDAL